jgi:tetratricopeptide (TPR) repeat protein
MGNEIGDLEAVGRLEEALSAAEHAVLAALRSGDKARLGVALQNQGSLLAETGRADRAVELHASALRLFEEARDEANEMRTCSLLGAAEQSAGRLAEARGWYERARGIARARDDRPALAAIAQDLGSVCQLEGESAREHGDEARAEERLQEAARCVGESLALLLAAPDEPLAAGAGNQLAKIHLLLGELDQAEAEAHDARGIRERLGLKEVWMDYALLAQVAHARGPGHAAEAEAWEQKRDQLGAELDRRAGTPTVPIDGLIRLAVACAEAGLGGGALDAEEEAALAAVATWASPLADLAPFLRALARREAPAIPPGLPAELGAKLGEIVEAVRRERG